MIPTLTPAQRATIEDGSDAFALWRHCPRGTCRRAHACRGFAALPIADCVPELAKQVADTLDALRALVRRRESGLTAQINRMTARVAALAERKIEKMERMAGRPQSFRDGAEGPLRGAAE
jgi:hypothetical protein